MPRKNRTAAFALAAAATLITIRAEPARAEIYKLIDTDGRVTYSNTPMPGAVAMAGLDSAPVPSEEDVRAAQEAYRYIEALGTDMEKRRLQLEEQRARLNMEERMWEAYLQPSRASVIDYNVPWIFAIDAGAHRMHINPSPRTRDGEKHVPPVRMHVGIDKRSP